MNTGKLLPFEPKGPARRPRRKTPEESIAVQLRLAAVERMTRAGADPLAELDVVLMWLAIAEGRLDHFLNYRERQKSVAELTRHRDTGA